MSDLFWFVIELSGEERAELERRIACYTLPHKVVQRAKMILYAADGQSNAEIARRLEAAADVVGRWRKRFFEERLAGLSPEERLETLLSDQELLDRLPSDLRGRLEELVQEQKPKKPKRKRQG